MKLVIDSSVFIDYLRNGPISVRFIESLDQQNPELFIPTVVIFELFSGKSSQNQLVRLKIMNLIRDCKRIELTEPIAIRAGEFFRGLGKQISSQDYIIAASALSVNAQVVTLNRKHFEKIPGVQVYDL